jgi:hypothetical protein
MESCNDKIF